MRKNVVIECVHLRIENLLKLSNSDLNLEKWQVEVESIKRKVKRKKSGDMFLEF